MRRIIVSISFIVLASLCIVAAGCNTMEGFGKDVESSGEAIKESAADHHD